MTNGTNTAMVVPKIEPDALSRNYGRFVVSPLESGYGVTIGNALRRVLLSSLEGAAITSVRISDVYHEYTDILGIKEDVLQIVLQLKQVRLILHEGDATRLRLDVRGEGTITAADIQCPAEVEIVNPELYLFTVDDDSTQLEIDMVVQRGRGYVPADQHARLPIGELPVDAIFSPVRRVNYTVESARVGQDTNYDKLTVEVWTDGTLRPRDALSQAATILMQQLRYIAGVGEEMLEPIRPDTPEPSINSEIYDTPIESLDLSVRVFNSLKRTGITTVGEVMDQLMRGQDAMLAIRNFGEKSLDELRQKLVEKGYLKEDDALPKM